MSMIIKRAALMGAAFSFLLVDDSCDITAYLFGYGKQVLYDISYDRPGISTIRGLRVWQSGE